MPAPAAISPPQDYEALIRRIHDNYARMSKTWQRISVYLTQNPNEVALNSINALAQRCAAASMRPASCALRNRSATKVSRNCTYSFKNA